MKRIILALFVVTLTCFAGKLNIVTNSGTTQIDFNQIASMEIVADSSMVLVNGGTFLMGQDGLENSGPAHTVTVSSFYIGKTEVTQAEWVATMGNNPANFVGDLNPIEEINWYSMVIYCNKRSIDEGLTPCYTLNNSTNPADWGPVPTEQNTTWDTNITCNWSANGYRLPTSAEWEFAARGGNSSQGYDYAGSNSLDDIAWWDGNSGYQPHQVGTKAPNELGLHDMSGNEWEFCWDWYGDYDSATQVNPHGPADGATYFYQRVIRGGSFFSSNNCLTRMRQCRTPGMNWDTALGFRLARTAP